MAKVSLRDIYKSFDKTEVIHGVSCDIADGEFIVLLGPSGCGKSTVLRMIAGLETITSGEISIGDNRGQSEGTCRPGHRHGVSELRPLPPHERV